MDHELLASEFLRALRGKRSQPAFARRLGYKSNVIYTWESGRGFPTAARTLQAAQRIGIDVRERLREFYRRPPAWLDHEDVCSAEGVSILLSDLRGRTSILALAESTGKSRFAVSRWLKGDAEPRLPDFFRMVDATSLRLLDFVGAFVDPKMLPSVEASWSELEGARRAAYAVPWTQAVLRALELSEYKALPRHKKGWIASRTGMDLEEELRCLDLLQRTGQIRFSEGKYHQDAILTVDTRKDPDLALQVRAFWAEVGLERLRDGHEGLFAYNLFGVSEDDYQRIRALQRAYFRELRAIVARSEPVERVVLTNLQLIPMDTPGK